MAADCRVTITRPGKPEVHADIAQKIFQIHSHIALGFAGNVALGGEIIHDVIHRPQRKRANAISTLLWLIRFLRYRYETLDPSRFSDPRVIFMAGAVFPDRPNVVSKKAIVELAFKIAEKHHQGPALIFNLLNTPRQYSHVPVPGSGCSRLVVLRSPNFIPEVLQPLQFGAIGSGEKVVEAIEPLHPLIMAMPGQAQHEALSIGTAAEFFMRENNIKSVGGMCAVVKVDKSGVRFFAHQRMDPTGAEKNIELKIQNGQWVQRNNVTGKTIPLCAPWKLQYPADDLTFDDLKDFWGK